MRSASAMTLASLSRITGASVNSRKYGWQRDAVPAAHDGRVQAAAALLVDGTRQAHPDAVDLRVAMAGVVEQRVEPLDHVGHQVVGAEAELLVDIGAGQDVAGQVAHRQPGPAAPDRRGQHDAGVGVERQKRGGTSAGRGRLFSLDDQPLIGERGTPGRIPRCGKARSDWPTSARVTSRRPLISAKTSPADAVEIRDKAT